MDVVPTTWCSLLSQGIVPTTWVMASILVDHYKYNTKYNWSLLLTCCNGDRCSSRCCTTRAPRTCCSGGGSSGGWRMASPVPWSSSSSPRRRCSTRCSGGNITKKVGGWRPLGSQFIAAKNKRSLVTNMATFMTFRVILVIEWQHNIWTNMIVKMIILRLFRFKW